MYITLFNIQRSDEHYIYYISEKIVFWQTLQHSRYTYKNVAQRYILHSKMHIDG